MNKLLITIIIWLSACSARAGLIFDNGSGEKNDTLVIQFCLIDSSGRQYTTWDTAYIVQAYGGTDFNIDTLTGASGYDLNSTYPRTLMFEYRLKASNSNGDLGAYTWWALLVDNNNGTDTHQMHYGSYYVNSDPIEDFLATSDSGSTGASYLRSKYVYDKSGYSLADSQVFMTTGNVGGVINNVNINSNSDLTAIKTKTDKLTFDARNAVLSNPDSASLDSLDVKPNFKTMLDNHGGTATIPPSLTSRVDSIMASLGWKGSSIDLHSKIGAYAGGNGDNQNIKDDIAALSISGSGSEAETLYVFDNDTTALEGVSVTVRNLAQTSTKVPGLQTDSNGRLITELDPGSYVVALRANNYIQTDLDTINVVSGGGTDILWITDFNPGDPPSPNLCRVYGRVYDIVGDSLANIVVTVEIPSEYQPVKYDDVIITPFKKTTQTDIHGYWQIDLIPNSLLSKTSSKYLFTIEYPSGVIYKSKVAVPDLSSWQLQ